MIDNNEIDKIIEERKKCIQMIHVLWRNGMN